MISVAFTVGFIFAITTAIFLTERNTPPTTSYSLMSEGDPPFLLEYEMRIYVTTQEHNDVADQALREVLEAWRE